jgi:hypothetical protein
MRNNRKYHTDISMWLLRRVRLQVNSVSILPLSLGPIDFDQATRLPSTLDSTTAAPAAVNAPGPKGKETRLRPAARVRQGRSEDEQ